MWTALRSALHRYGARALGAAPVVAAAFIVLPGPLPTPGLPTTQQVLPSAVVSVLPTPSLPVNLPASPPPLAGVSVSPTAAATAAPTGGGGAGSGVTHGSAGAGNPTPAASAGGLPIPFTSLVISSPLDIALIGALVTLPLLFGIWLLLFGRTFVEARRAREAHVRLTLAADLGVKPRELTAMSAKTLFNLREKAAFDELTGTLRRAAGIAAAEREIARARRHGTPLAIAFVDIDGLKEANERRGHQAGDRLLRGLSAALKAGLRSQDVVFRYGGDEFVCLLPDTTAKAAGAKLGAIQQAAATSGIRFCAGVAELQRSDDVVSLFARADRELYDFKANRGEIVQLPAPGAVKKRRRTGATA